MENEFGVFSAANNLNVERVEPIEPECLHNGFFRSVACGEVLYRMGLRVRIVEFAKREKLVSERRCPLQEHLQVRGIDQVDAN